MSLLELIADFQAAVEAVDTVDALAKAIVSTITMCGFRYYALTHHVDFEAPPRGAFRLHNYPDEWATYFDRHGLGVRDPVHRASQLRGAGFAWSSIGRMIKLTADDRAVLRDAARAGIGDGYTVPFHVPGEYSGSASLAVLPGEHLSGDQIAVAQLLGCHAFEAARRLLARSSDVRDKAVALTQRQRQCVVWLGHGKSEWEIGKILALSPRTVNQHLKLARERCGVSKSSSLVVHALVHRAISYNELLDR